MLPEIMFLVILTRRGWLSLFLLQKLARIFLILLDFIFNRNLAWFRQDILDWFIYVNLLLRSITQCLVLRDDYWIEASRGVRVFRMRWILSPKYWGTCHRIHLRRESWIHCWRWRRILTHLKHLHHILLLLLLILLKLLIVYMTHIHYTRRIYIRP